MSRFLRLQKHKGQTKKGQAGICFTHDALTLAYVAQEKNLPCLQHLLHLDTSQDDQQITLKEKVERLNLQGSEAVVLLPFSDYQIFLIKDPQVPDSEKQNAIRWQIAEYIDYPIEEAVIDFIELPAKQNADHPMIYAVVTKKNKINEIASQVTSSGLKLKSIDICQSALRQIAIHLEDSEEGQALLHLEGKSHLLIFKNKTLYMMRSLDIEMDFDSPELYHELSSEIQKSLDYCASNLQNANVSRIILTPLKEKRPQLLSYLSNVLGLPVREMSFSELLENTENISLENSTASTFAIGAALSKP